MHFSAVEVFKSHGSAQNVYTPVIKLILRSLLGLMGGLVVAFVASHFLDVHLAEVWHHVQLVPAWATIFCVASSFVVLGLQSLRWHRVMGPLLGLSYFDALRAQGVGFLFNALLPARGGDLLRVQYLGRRTGKSRATILGTEMVDRWLDWWGWIPTFIALAILSNPPLWLYKALGVFAAILIGWGLGVVIITRAGKTPREGSTMGKVFSAIRLGTLVVKDRRIWVTAFVIAPLPWLWEAVAISIAGRAFGCPLNLVQAFSVLMAFNLAYVVPAPGGVGTIESGGMLALTFFGFDHSAALAFMTVYHFSQLLPGVMFGAGVLLAQGERLFGTLAHDGEAPLDALEGPDRADSETPALAK